MAQDLVQKLLVIRFLIMLSHLQPVSQQFSALEALSPKWCVRSTGSPMHTTCRAHLVSIQLHTSNI
jgi:hypothetical protein